MLFRPRDKQSLFSKLKNFLWPRKGLQRAWVYVWHRLTRLSASSHVIALGFAIGAFTSLTPFIGFHFIIAGLLAFALGGNIIASALGTSVGNPLTFPFFWIGTYETGSWILRRTPEEGVKFVMPEGMTALLFHNPAEFFHVLWDTVFPVLFPMLVGSIPIGLAIGSLCYFIVKPLVRQYQKNRQARVARRGSRNTTKPVL